MKNSTTKGYFNRFNNDIKLGFIMKYFFLLLVFSNYIFSQEYQIDKLGDPIESIRIMNIFRNQYHNNFLEYDEEYSKIAFEQARLSSLKNDFVLNPEDSIGDLGFFYTKDLIIDNRFKENDIFISTVLNFLDIDCDEEDTYERYNSFNQVLDPKSSKVGIGWGQSNDKIFIHYIFDHWYKQD